MQGADSISGEFGGPGTDLTQYYAGGAYVPGGTIGYPYGVATPIPTSGTISLSNFHGSKREYLLTFYDDAQWTVPAGVTKCDIVVVAGGGAGGPSHTSSIEGGGGGGGWRRFVSTKRIFESWCGSEYSCRERRNFVWHVESDISVLSTAGRTILARIDRIWRR